MEATSDFSALLGSNLLATGISKSKNFFFRERTLAQMRMLHKRLNGLSAIQFCKKFLISCSSLLVIGVVRYAIRIFRLGKSAQIKIYSQLTL